MRAYPLLFARPVEHKAIRGGKADQKHCHAPGLGKVQLHDLPHEVSRSEAGLHLLLHMRNGMLERELVERAKAAGVRVYALSAYYMPPVRPPRATLVLGYAGMTGEQIDEAAARLRRAWTKEM